MRELSFVPLMRSQLQARSAARRTAGSLRQLARSSSAVSRRITVCAVRWLGNVTGLGLTMIG